ncbi:probable clathrin assembly protein At4g32285 [Miscanthus floridulus]|uniref:probable clathrin assembly protein At4g32285 n=1 Tax=Miscanthus floridulus TaxID=154761 RepID=UPI00345993E2
MSIRKALGAFKDQATIGITRVTGAVAPDLDVAIVRATSHDDATPDDRHAREVLRLASATGAAPACVASIARRLSKTRDYVVAAKCLALLHRLAAADADPDPAEDADGEGRTRFLHELLRPTLTGRRAGEPVLALLLDFRDEAHTASWDHSAFVRAYTTYLLDRVRFLVLLLPAPRFADDRVRGPPHTAAADMDTEALLGRARHLRHLLDRLLACRPAGSAGASRVVRAALHPLLRDSFRVYEDVALVLALLLDRFFDMDYPECVKAFETYVGTAKQIDALRAFYAWCDDAGVARSSNFPDIRRVDDKLLETMEQFLREHGRAGRASPPRSARESAVNAQGDDVDHVDDMNGIKALPAPERSSGAERARPIVVPTNEADQSVLVDLREPAATADEQGNKLALALFSAPPATNSTWVTFPSESDADAAAQEPAVTSAWQTPAAEPGKADWELALVETASNLSKQASSLRGGMDTLLLGGMYDQGAVRQQVAAQAASGSASSVALLPGGRQVAPVLMLPGPDGSTVRQVAGGDPFAASLAVPPPSYVQMAEMERKQQQLVQEQQMWAQYRQGGKQGQPGGFNGLAGGSVFTSNAAMAVPYGYGMPMAYNQVGGYY